MTIRNTRRFLITLVLLLLPMTLQAQFLETRFTYQGYLELDGQPVNGTCTIRFDLYETSTGGSPITGGTRFYGSIPVVDGIFTVNIDFDDTLIFENFYPFLEVSPDCGTGYQTLSPRQQIFGVPFAQALLGMRTIPDSNSPSIIGGYEGNILADGIVGATISGGGNVADRNRVYDNYSTISGGIGNIAGSNDGSTQDTTNAPYVTISGGHDNVAEAPYATVGGGINNVASAARSVVAGGSNNTANGLASTVLGGESNFAAGDYSVAIGERARLTGVSDNTFLWNDGEYTGNPIASANRFIAISTRGAAFYSGVSSDGSTITSGVNLAAGAGSWSTFSDRNVKEDFEPVDTQTVLDALAAMPLTTWEYIAQDDVRHMGVMAQDFRAAFGLGVDERHIDTVDMDGVLVASVQALNEQNQQLRAEIDDLKEQQSRNGISPAWLIVAVMGSWLVLRRRD